MANLELLLRQALSMDPEDLAALNAKLEEVYEKYLAESGVKLPRIDSPKRLEILCLFAHEGRPISQTEIAEWIENAGGLYKFQARHLASSCWYVVSGNKKSHNYDERCKHDELMLVTSKQPNPNCGKVKVNVENQLKLYYETLRQLVLNSRSGVIERCHRWLDIFDSTNLEISSQQWSVESLPILLALVHPDEYFDQRGEDFSKSFETPHGKSKFPNTLILDEDCQLNELRFGLTCPYAYSSGVQMDHYWPHSLGGPTSNDNMVYLCRKCNQQKSSSPFYYNFEAVPTWLVNRIQTMHSHKSRSW